MSSLGAGLWSAAPPVVTPQNFVQMQEVSSGSLSSTTSQIPNDDTIPQVSEGAQFLSSLSITPTDAANILVVEGVLYLAGSNALVHALFRTDAGSNALACGTQANDTASFVYPVHVQYQQVAGTTSLRTFTSRGGSGAAGTTYFNGNSVGRKYGGVLRSYLRVWEIRP